MIEANQTQIEVDEPEEDAMALLMGAEPDKPAEDDMSEEKLLRALMEAQGQKADPGAIGCGPHDRRRRPDRSGPHLQPKPISADRACFRFGARCMTGSSPFRRAVFHHPVAVAAS